MLDFCGSSDLPSKLDHYSTRDVANKWFETFLYNKNSMCLLMVLNHISPH